MPLGPKLVFGFQTVNLASSVFLAFAGFGVYDAFAIAIAAALFIGLYLRHRIAWMAARWLAATVAIIMSIFFVLAVMSGTTHLWILALVAFEISLTWAFSYLLGRVDSRVYFGVPRQA